MSFNRGGFNRLAFNRGAGQVLFLTCTMDGASGAESFLYKQTHIVCEADGDSEITVLLTQEISQNAVMDGACDISITKTDIHKVIAAEFDGSGNLDASTNTIALLRDVNVFGAGAMDAYITQVIASGADIGGSSDCSIVLIHERLLGADMDGTTGLELGRANITSFLQTDLEGETRINVNAIMIWGSSLTLDGSSFVSLPHTNMIFGPDLTLDGRGDLLPNTRMTFAMICNAYGTGDLFAISDTISIEYAQTLLTLQPGDILIIDSGDYTVTLNGQNVYHDYAGDWIMINPYSQKLICESTNGDMEIKIDYIPRYL